MERHHAAPSAEPYLAMAALALLDPIPEATPRGISLNRPDEISGFHRHDIPRQAKRCKEIRANMSDNASR